jgi:HlyD family secretion protein
LADAERLVVRQQELRAKGVAAEASFDTARAQRDAQKASLASARAQLASAKAQMLGLQADLQVARAQLQAASAQVLQREAAVRQIEVDLRNTEIRSPVSGTVVQRNVELGATVAASLQAPTLFLIADDLRHMEVAANIDESDVGRLKPGQKTSFTVNAYPGRTFEGTVKQVRLGSQTVANVVIYTAIISVENPRKELMPGMTANLRVETDVRENVLRVANAALRWRPPGAEPIAQQAAGSGEAVAAERPAGEERRRGGGGRVMAELAAALKAELSLSADQQKEVDSILADARKEMGMALRAEQDPNARRERIRQQWNDTMARIAALLTEPQRGKLDELRQRFAQEREQRGATQRGRVYVLGADGRPQAIEVRVGVGDGGTTEIISDKLEAGRDVIIGGGPRVADAAGAAGATARRGPRFGF